MSIEANPGTEYWAWVTRYEDGSVGNISVYLRDMGGHTVLIARSRDMANKMRPFAMSHAKLTGQRCWLRYFKMAKDELDVIGEA